MTSRTPTTCDLPFASRSQDLPAKEDLVWGKLESRVDATVEQLKGVAGASIINLKDGRTQ